MRDTALHRSTTIIIHTHSWRLFECGYEIRIIVVWCKTHTHAEREREIQMENLWSS
jgi:hypothetical protein